MQEAQEDYKRQRETDSRMLGEKGKSQIIALATDRSILVLVRFRGGETETLQMDAPKSAVELFTTSKQTIDRIDALLALPTTTAVSPLFSMRKDVEHPTGRHSAMLPLETSVVHMA